MCDCWLKDNCKQLHCEDENGCLILYKLNYLYDQAGVSIKQRKYIPLRIDDDGTDLEEFKQLKDIQDNILDFVQSGKQLYIHSSICGNGKTAWSLRLLQTYFKKIWLRTEMKCRALFINVPNLLISLKENISSKSEYIKHIKDNMYEADIIIWDDVGTKGATNFEHENLFSFIDQRINLGKANIFTSNLTDEELHDALGDRLASRICNLGYNIELHGGDKRGIPAGE